MLKPLLLTLLITIGLNANNSLPIHFYEDGKLEKSTFKEKFHLDIETFNNEDRTKVITGPYWDGHYSSNATTEQKLFLHQIKNNILRQHGKIFYSDLECVHCLVKNGGKKYWATITRIDSHKYEVKLVEEEDSKIVFSEKTKIPQKSLNNSFVFHGLKFSSGKYALLLGSEVDLNKIEKLLRESPSLRIRIEGHTDNKPSRTISNKELSEKRALAVKKALIERGIDASRLESVGLGDTCLIVGATDAENRRVEVHPLEPKKSLINIERFPNINGYKKNIDKNNETYTLARYELIKKEQRAPNDEIITYYKKIIVNLRGKVISQKDDHQIIFSFNQEISGKLTIAGDGAYFISISNKKGEM